MASQDTNLKHMRAEVVCARLARQQMPRAAHAEFSLDQRCQRDCERSHTGARLGWQKNKKAVNKSGCLGNMLDPNDYLDFSMDTNGCRP
jgi:hypothetical protein